MNDHENLLREIAVGEQWFQSHCLRDAACDTNRIKQRVQIALHEQWLSVQTETGMADVDVRAIKAAVYGVVQAASRRRAYHVIIYRLLPATVGAAALIAFAAVGYQVARNQMQSRNEELVRSEDSLPDALVENLSASIASWPDDSPAQASLADASPQEDSFPDGENEFASSDWDEEAVILWEELNALDELLTDVWSSEDNVESTFNGT